MWWLRGEAMRIFIGMAVALAALICPAWAQSAGATIQAFGLVGAWATDCAHEPDAHQAGYKMIFAVPGKGPPTRTIVSSDGAQTTTTQADILGASRLGTTGLVIEAEVTGGDRDGALLPASALLGLDQSFEKNEPNVLYQKGHDPMRLVRCGK
jgi:hypothetical protein